MASPNRSTYLAEMSRPHWPRLLGAVVCLVLLSGVNLALPWAPKKAIDEVFPSGNMVQLTWLLAALLGVYLVRNLLYFVAGYLTAHVAERVAFGLRERLLAHMASLPMEFYKAHKPGQIVSRVIDDVAVVRTFIQRQAIKLIIDGLMFVGVLAVVSCMNLPLAAAAVSVFPLHALACLCSRRRLKQRTEETRDHKAAMASGVIDLVAGASLIKASAAQEREHSAHMDRMRMALEANVGLASLSLRQKVIADLLVGVGTVAVFCYGAHVVARGDMTIGSFVAFYTYIATLYPLTARLTSRVPDVLAVLTSFDRTAELLDVAATEAGDQHTAATDAPIRGDVKLQGVTFGYAEDLPVLTDVTFRVHAGEHVLISGSNGAGKSSLLGLLARFHEPTHGQVLIDGISTAAWPHQTLREQVGFAFQEPHLLDGTIRDNIAYAAPEATDAQTAHAADQAGATELIERLPDGLDTVLGTGGVHLSPGQKQRIALARVLLRAPAVLVIDDAFAAFDAESKARIWKSIHWAMQGRTVIIAASDPNGLDGMDRVLRLQDGQVEEQTRPSLYNAA